MKKLIIFGATGTLGAYLTDYLLDNPEYAAYEPIAVGRRNTNFFSGRNVPYFQVDNTRKEDFDRLPGEIDAVILLSGLLPAYMRGYRPEEYFEVNTIGGLNVLEYAKRAGAKTFVYTQSFSDLAGYFGKEKILYADMPRKLNYRNDHTLYVISKCAVVDMMEYYRQTCGIRPFVLRLPNIYMYTPNDEFYVDGIKKKIGYRLMMERAVRGEEIEVWGDPTKVKDMVYVKDFCQMVGKALISSVDGGVYNVGTGIGTSLLDQIEGIRQVFCPRGRLSPLKFCPDKPDSPEYIMDISNAVRDLGYRPRFGYMDYLRDFRREQTLDRYRNLTKSFSTEEKS